MASSSAPASSAAGPHGQQLGSGGLGGRGEPRASGFVSEAESKRRSAFEGDIATMMHGFGDARAPLPESIALIEDIVCEFFIKMTKEASKLSTKRGKKNLAFEDLLLLVRKQPQMYYRARELNRKKKEFESARRMDQKKLEQLEKQLEK